MQKARAMAMAREVFRGSERSDLTFFAAMDNFPGSTGMIITGGDGTKTAISSRNVTRSRRIFSPHSSSGAHPIPR